MFGDRKAGFAVLALALIGLPFRVAGGDDVAQESLPVVRASSPLVDIEDGNRLLKGIWTVSPTVEIDTYHARRLSAQRTITFRTDMDAISFKVGPGQTHDFVVWLDGKHRCRTRISARQEPARFEKASGDARIPFQIGTDNKIHLKGQINDSVPLDLLFDMGADTTVLYPSAKAKKATVRVDGKTENAGTGGVATREVGSDNRIVLAGWRWDHESVLLIEKQADRADGIIGHNLFDGKVVAIDYDALEILIHDSVPEIVSSWAKLPIRFLGTLPGVSVKIDAGGEPFEEWLVLDTGSSLSVHLNQRSGESHPFPASIKRLGSSRMRGVGQGEVVNDVDLIPGIALGNWSLRDLPVHRERAGGMATVSGGHLGMDVLKRFNTMLDFQNDAAYFHPSAMQAVAYRRDYSSGEEWWIVAGLVGASALVLLGLWLARRARLKSSDKVKSD